MVTWLAKVGRVIQLPVSCWSRERWYPGVLGIGADRCGDFLAFLVLLFFPPFPPFVVGVLHRYMLWKVFSTSSYGAYQVSGQELNYSITTLINLDHFFRYANWGVFPEDWVKGGFWEKITSSTLNTAFFAIQNQDIKNRYERFWRQTKKFMQ